MPSRLPRRRPPAEAELRARQRTLSAAGLTQLATRNRSQVSSASTLGMRAALAPSVFAGEHIAFGERDRLRRRRGIGRTAVARDLFQALGATFTSCAMLARAWISALSPRNLRHQRFTFGA